MLGLTPSIRPDLVVGRQGENLAVAEVHVDGLSDTVVPVVENTAPALAGHHTIPNQYFLDGDLTSGCGDKSSADQATVTTGTKTLDVIWGVSAEELGLCPVRPSDGSATDRLPELETWIVHP